MLHSEQIQTLSRERFQKSQHPTHILVFWQGAVDGDVRLQGQQFFKRRTGIRHFRHIPLSQTSEASEFGVYSLNFVTAHRKGILIFTI